VKRKIVYEEGDDHIPNRSLHTQVQTQKRVRIQSRKRAVLSEKGSMGGGGGATITDIAHTQSLVGAHTLTTPHSILTVQMPNESKTRRSNWLMGTKIQWVQKYSCNLSKSNTKVAQHKITQYKIAHYGCAARIACVIHAGNTSLFPPPLPMISHVALYRTSRFCDGVHNAHVGGALVCVNALLQRE